MESPLPNADLHRRLCSVVEPHGVSWLTGLTSQQVDKNLIAKGLDLSARNERIVDVAASLFIEGVKYIADNFDDESEIKNIISYVMNSLKAEVFEIDGKVHKKKSLTPILFVRSAEETARFCAISSELPVEDAEAHGVINIIDSFSGEGIVINDEELANDTVTFVHEEQARLGNPIERLVIEYLYVPGTFIDQVGTNPIEALADIVEAGSIMRDCIIGIYDKYTSPFRAQIYRAEFLSEIVDEEGYDMLSESSRVALDWYCDILERPELARSIFYSRPVRLSGLTFDTTAADTGSPATTLN